MSDHPLIKAEQIGRISAVAGWLGVLVIAILSLVPGNLRPHTVLPGPLEHTLAYALTGAALAFGYRGMDFRLLCLVGLSAGSVVLEILQAFVPGVPHLPLTRWQVRAAPRWACCLERFFRNCSSLRRGNDIKKRSLADLIQCAPTARIADGALGRRAASLEFSPPPGLPRRPRTGALVSARARQLCGVRHRTERCTLSAWTISPMTSCWRTPLGTWPSTCWIGWRATLRPDARSWKGSSGSLKRMGSRWGLTADSRGDLEHEQLDGGALSDRRPEHPQRPSSGYRHIALDTVRSWAIVRTVHWDRAGR